MTIDTAIRLAFAVLFCLVSGGLVMLGDWMQMQIENRLGIDEPAEQYPQMDDWR